MKRLLLFGMMAGLAVAGSLTSCSSHDDVYNEESVAKYKHEAFTKSFINTFGEIDPNQTWGFGSSTTTRTEDVGGSFDNFVNDALNSYRNGGSLSATTLEGNKYLILIQEGNSSENYYLNAWGSRSKGRCVIMTPEEYTQLIKTETNGHINAEFVTNGTYTFVQSPDAGDRDQNDATKSSGYVYVVSDGIPGATRILAEDLGTIGDFDYNDAVIDVWGKQDIVIQAVGGTLPIYLSHKTNTNTKVELHELFGVDTKTTVNVGGTSHAPVTYTMPSETDKNNLILYVEMEDGSMVELTHTKGQAPEMLAVKGSFQWHNEKVRVDINTLPFDD